MSVMFKCECFGDKIDRRVNWRIVHYKHNHSVFEYPAGDAHPSDYSTVVCLLCRGAGRTKSKWVDELRELTAYERERWLHL